MGYLSLNYCVDGQGSSLLLMHSFGISFNIWNSLLSSACSNFTVFMDELPSIRHSPILGGAWIDGAAKGLERVQRLSGMRNGMFSIVLWGSVMRKDIPLVCRVGHASMLCTTFRLEDLWLACWKPSGPIHATFRQLDPIRLTFEISNQPVRFQFDEE